MATTFFKPSLSSKPLDVESAAGGDELILCGRRGEWQSLKKLLS
jgi:hypothetical protein